MSKYRSAMVRLPGIDPTWAAMTPQVPFWKRTGVLTTASA